MEKRERRKVLSGCWRKKDTVELAMEKIFYLGMMIAAGLLFGLQSPINAQLSRSVGVLEGSFLSFLGGTLVLGLAMLFFGKGHVGGVFGVPAWQLVGGLLGRPWYSIRFSVCPISASCPP